MIPAIMRGVVAGASSGAGPLAISGAPSTATVGTAYSWTPNVSGGSGTKSYALSDVNGQAPVLPPGLSFDTGSGRISGTPTHMGFWSGLKITVTDDSGSAETGMIGIYNFAASKSVPWGSLVVASGDSLFGQSAAMGFRNCIHHLYGKSAGKLKVGLGSDQGVGGETLANMNARIAQVSGQLPVISIMGGGQNTGFPAGSNIGTLLSPLRLAVNHLLTNTTGYVVLWTTPPSFVQTHDATVRAQVWRQMKLDVTNYYASPANQRIILVDVASGYDPATMNILDPLSGFDRRIHPNFRGAEWIAERFHYVLNSLIADNNGWQGLLPATRDASELLTNWQQAGTDGTLSGTGITGTAPTGVTVTNNLGGTSAVVVGRTSLGGGNYSLDLTVTGTPGAENSITVDYPVISLIGFGAGSCLQSFARLISQQNGAGGPPVGLVNQAHGLGPTLGATTLGQAGWSAADTNANDYPDPTRAIDWTTQSVPKMYWDDLGTAYFRVTYRFRATALNASLRIYIPSVKRAETVAYAAPKYNPTGQSANWLTSTAGLVGGNPVNGTTLTAIVGTITGGNIAGNITWQWKKNGVDIPGVTSQKYTPTGFVATDTLTWQAIIDNGISPPLVINSAAMVFP